MSSCMCVPRAPSGVPGRRDRDPGRRETGLERAESESLPVSWVVVHMYVCMYWKQDTPAYLVPPGLDGHSCSGHTRGV